MVAKSSRHVLLEPKLEIESWESGRVTAGVSGELPSANYLYVIEIVITVNVAEKLSVGTAG